MTDDPAVKSRLYFESGYYCAESVLLAIAENQGIRSDVIPKIATGFCSGLSRTCGMCGALSGGIMGISIMTGRRLPDESVEKNYALVQKFTAMFKDRFGTVNCKELIGCDLNTEEGKETYKSENLIEQCKGFTEEATRMVLSIMND